jgi:hypothetical protein
MKRTGTCRLLREENGTPRSGYPGPVLCCFLVGGSWREDVAAQGFAGEPHQTISHWIEAEERSDRLRGEYRTAAFGAVGSEGGAR